AVVRIALEALDRDAFAQRRLERGDEAVDVIDDLMANHKAMRIVAPVGKARQLALPVRRHQTERVPALGAPSMAGTLFLEHNVIYSRTLEVPADRQARLSAADDGHRMVRNGIRVRSVHGGSPSIRHRRPRGALHRPGDGRRAPRARS